MIKSITQSFIKDMIDFVEGDLCGNIVREKWVNDRLIDLDKKAIDLGCYFEYILTLKATGAGTLPKSGKIPLAEMMASGKEMLVDYRRSHANADRVIEYLASMHLKIVTAGYKVGTPEFEGTLDLVCEVTEDIRFHDGSTWKKGDRIIIDLKYSSLIDDKWSKFGWQGLMLPGPHVQKDHHGIQAKHYSMLYPAPFYYLITSSKNEKDILFLYMNVDAVDIEMYKNEAKAWYEKFLFIVGVDGLYPKPEISKCNECPLKDECTDKHVFPHPITVTL